MAGTLPAGCPGTKRHGSHRHENTRSPTKSHNHRRACRRARDALPSEKQRPAH